MWAGAFGINRYRYGKKDFWYRILGARKGIDNYGMIIFGHEKDFIPMDVEYLMLIQFTVENGEITTSVYE